MRQNLQKGLQNGAKVAAIEIPYLMQLFNFRKKGLKINDILQKEVHFSQFKKKYIDFAQFIRLLCVES